MSRFNLRKNLRSFKYAFRGLFNLIKEENNAKVHLAATLIVGYLSWYFHVNRLEATLVFFAVVLVFVTEITNTAIEKLLDLLHPQSHSQIEYVKDAMAGAVLISATIALTVFLLIFYPYMLAR